MSTFESALNTRLASMDDEEKVNFLLKAAPYILEYSADDDPSSVASSSPAKKGQLDSYVNVVGTSKKNEIFTKYQALVEGNVSALSQLHVFDMDEKQTDEICVCGEKMCFDVKESALVCTLCGESKQYSYSSTKNLSYTDEVSLNQSTAFSYKRINHFIEHINSIQARESTEVPGEVIEQVKAEFRKERTSKRGEIKATKVRSFLKKLGLSKYYENTQMITQILNGTPAPKFSIELEQKLRNMFIVIQVPFAKHCPPGRKNFLSYNYTIHKMLQLLGHDEYLRYFPLLKSTEKLHACDVVWKGICREMAWEYVASC